MSLKMDFSIHFTTYFVGKVKETILSRHVIGSQDISGS
jgi:hypothetical protein